MIIESTLALVGASALLVAGVKVCNHQTYEEAIDTIKGWIKENAAPYQPFSLRGVPGFSSGLEEIVKKYSSLPINLTSTFQGTTGKFDFFQVQIAADDIKRAIFEKAFENLIIKTINAAGFTSFQVYVLSDLINTTTGETIVTGYYAVNSDSMKSLDDWYMQQVNLQKAALLTPPSIDKDLEKDMEENGC